MLQAIRATKFPCRCAWPVCEEELNSTGRGVLSFKQNRYSYRPFHLSSYLTGGHGALTHMVYRMALVWLVLVSASSRLCYVIV